MSINNDRLKELRVERKIPLKEIANALGFKTAGAYQRIENGENKLKAEALPVIAQVLKIDIYLLIREIFFELQLDESSSFGG